MHFFPNSLLLFLTVVTPSPITNIEVRGNEGTNPPADIANTNHQLQSLEAGTTDTVKEALNQQLKELQIRCKTSIPGAVEPALVSVKRNFLSAFRRPNNGSKWDPTTNELLDTIIQQICNGKKIDYREERLFTKWNSVKDVEAGERFKMEPKRKVEDSSDPGTKKRQRPGPSLSDQESAKEEAKAFKASANSAKPSGRYRVACDHCWYAQQQCIESKDKTRPECKRCQSHRKICHHTENVDRKVVDKAMGALSVGSEDVGGGAREGEPVGRAGSPGDKTNDELEAANTLESMRKVSVGEIARVDPNSPKPRPNPMDLGQMLNPA